MTIKLSDHRPDEQAALQFIEQNAAQLLEAGMSAETVANLMLYAAYYLHARAQGAGNQVDGWQERTHSSFQRAITGFMAETCGIILEVPPKSDFPISRD